MHIKSFEKNILSALPGKLLFFLAASCGLLPLSLQSEERPNIILIMGDDLGYECIGANGGESYETANIDRLAAEGIRFDQMHAQPICTPSRVKLMTGKSNVRNYRVFGLLPMDDVTFPQILQKSGYETCIVGKWQLGGGLGAPNAAGFDEYCLWQVARAPGRYPNPGLEINGVQKNFSNGEYGPDIVTDYALKFVERNRHKPFFLYYPMILPHKPMEPTPDSADWDPSSPGSPDYHGDPRYFDDMVAYMDKLVGKIDRKLESLGIKEETLIIFTGDNGTDRPIVSRMDGRDIVGSKKKTVHAGTHVPMIARWPGTVEPGSINNDLLDFSDFFPTLCAVGRAPVAAEARPLDGRSFLPQLKGKPGDPREWIYCWYARLQRHDPIEAKQFVRNHHYKLYSSGAFHNLETDPDETEPLSFENLSPEEQALWRRFETILADYDALREGKHW